MVNRKPDNNIYIISLGDAPYGAICAAYGRPKAVHRPRSAWRMAQSGIACAQIRTYPHPSLFAPQIRAGIPVPRRQYKNEIAQNPGILGQKTVFMIKFGIICPKVNSFGL